MPGRREPDGAVGHAFGLEVDGVQVAVLTEVSGLAVERDVLEFREGGADGDVVAKRLPGRLKAGEVVLTRGLTGDRTFEQWMDEVSLDATAARKDAAVVVFDRRGQTVARFTLAEAWPRRLEYAGLRAGFGEALTETLTLVHEGIDRT